MQDIRSRFLRLIGMGESTDNPKVALEKRSLTKAPALTTSQAQAILKKYHGTPQTIRSLSEITNGYTVPTIWVDQPRD